MCIRDRYKVEANVGAPQVAYKETIKKSVEQDTKYARQSGGWDKYLSVAMDSSLMKWFFGRYTAS